ncbi:MAG: hypothetical protein ACLUI3_13440 [Christensenellales bacterium]
MRGGRGDGRAAGIRAGFVQDSNLPKGSERFVKSLRDAIRPHSAAAV